MRPPLIELPPTPSSAAIITSSSRLESEIKYSFAYRRVQRKETAWAPQEVLSWERWTIDRHSDLVARSYEPACRHLISGETLRIAVESTAPGKSVERHASTFEAAWRMIHDWGLWPVWNDVKETADGRLCYQWSRNFRELLDERELITAPELAPMLVQAVSHQVLAADCIAAVGFDRPTRIQSTLLNTLARHGCRVIETKPTATAKSTPSLIGFPDTRRERMSSALWARKQLGSDPSSRIGILVAGISAEHSKLRRTFEAVFPELEEVSQVVNFNRSHALSESALGSEISAFLNWTVNDVHYSELRQLARSRYLKNLGLPPSPASLGRERVNFKWFARQSGLDWLNQFSAAIPTTRKMLPARWTEVIGSLLNDAGWRLDAESNHERLQRQQVIRAINQVAGSGVVLGPVTWRGAVKLMTESIDKAGYPAPTRFAPIQVMTHDESRHLTFDSLWVTGLSDAEWPKAASPNPMIPMGMQRRAQIHGSTHSDELANARELTAFWHKSASDVVFSYADPDEDVAAQPSTLVADNAHAAAKDLLGRSSGLAERDHVWSRPARPELLEEYASVRGTGMSTPTESKYSAYLLEAQSNCPFKAFGMYRLGLKQEAEPSLFPGPLERGSIIHEILEHITKECPTRDAIVALQDSRIRTIVREHLDPLSKRLPEAFVRNEVRVVCSLVQRWRKTERSRLHFEVDSAERPLEGELGGVRFSTRVDRVDDTGLGGQLIIDYKVSKAKVPRWDAGRPQQPQLPLYYLLAEDAGWEPKGIGFYFVHKDGAILRSWPCDLPVGGKEFEPVTKDWRRDLTRLAEEFASGVAAVDPQDNACRNCHLHSLCRVFEQS